MVRFTYYNNLQLFGANVQENARLSDSPEAWHGVCIQIYVLVCSLQPEARLQAVGQVLQRETCDKRISNH